MGIEVFIIAAIAAIAESAVLSFIVTAAISYGVTSLLAPSGPSSGFDVPAARDPGARQRIPSDPENKLAVIYGEAGVSGSITFADISEDKQKMGFIISLCEGEIESFDKIFWDDKELVFGVDDDGNPLDITTGLRQVTDAIDGDGVSDSFLNANLRIRAYKNGGRSMDMEGFSTKWAEDFNNRTMPGVAYLYVELTYNRDDHVTGLTNNLTAQVKGKRIAILQSDGTLGAVAYSDNPSSCSVDYLLSELYGCGDSLTIDDLDLNLFYTWHAFCDEDVDHFDTDGTTVITANRYSCNGFANTTIIRDTIIADMMMCGSASLTYSLGKLSPIIDKPTASTFTFNEDNIYEGVGVRNSGIKEIINDMTLKYAASSKFFQGEQSFLTAPMSVRNQNEPSLPITIDLPFTNNNIEAERLGTILINKSRQTQSVVFNTNAEALANQAGDVFTFSFAPWGILNKEYRVQEISHTQLRSGAMGYEIIGREYSADTYADRMFNLSDVAPNSGFPNARRINPVSNLTTANNEPSAVIPNFDLSWTVPTNSLITSFDIFVNAIVSEPFTGEGTQLIATIRTSDSTYSSGDTVVHNISGLSSGIYNFWVVPSNEFAKGSQSNTLQVTWSPAIMASGITINPEWSKSAIVVSDDTNGDTDLTNATVSFFLLVGDDKATLIDTNNDDGLGSNEWRFVSVTPSSTITSLAVADIPDNEVDVTIQSFTSNGQMTISYRYKGSDGMVSAFTSSIDVAQAPSGMDGFDGTVGSVRYSLRRTNRAGIDDTAGEYWIGQSDGTSIGAIDVEFSSLAANVIRLYCTDANANNNFTLFGAMDNTQDILISVDSSNRGLFSIGSVDNTNLVSDGTGFIDITLGILRRSIGSATITNGVETNVSFGIDVGRDGVSGTSGTSAPVMIMVPLTTTSFVQDPQDGSFNATSTVFDTMVSLDGTTVARNAIRVNYNSTTRVLSIVDDTHGSGDLNAGNITFELITVSGSATDLSATIVGTYTIDGDVSASKAESVTVVFPSPRVRVGTVFTNVTHTDPPTISNVGATYSFSNNTFTGLVNFTTTAPTVSVGATDSFYQASYTVSEATFGGTQSIVFGSVFDVVSFNGLVTFTSLSTAGQSNINGGNITTNTLSLNTIINDSTGERLVIRPFGIYLISSTNTFLSMFGELNVTIDSVTGEVTETT